MSEVQMIAMSAWSNTQGPIGFASAAGELMKNSCTATKKAQRSFNAVEILKSIAFLMNFEIGMVKFFSEF
ncbi:MAG: hypothetical protein F6K58_09915 [Symploca sp. SIO2E9]|nr:hypothetical protein [Symploca sp. SIO2E9]